jgi:hypothetical protein
MQPRKSGTGDPRQLLRGAPVPLTIGAGEPSTFVSPIGEDQENTYLQNGM